MDSLGIIQDLKCVLLIDDAIGSGATMHAVAGKLKRINPKLTVIAVGVVGSFKGYDVVQDV